MVRKKKKKVKEHTQFDDVPQYLKEFIDFIALKERPDEADDRKKKFASKRKKVVKEEEFHFQKLSKPHFRSRPPCSYTLNRSFINSKCLEPYFAPQGSVCPLHTPHICKSFYKVNSTINKLGI